MALQYRDLVQRTAFDVRMVASSFLNVRSGFASKAAALAGIACAFLPFDLIPDHLPVVGYLDEMSYVIIGMTLSSALLPREYEDEFKNRHMAAGSPSLQPSNAMSWLQTERTHVRSAALRLAFLQCLAFVIATPLLRLTMGRWPRAPEIAAFRKAFANFAPVPPLLRALASVPAARHQLMRTMLISWMKADAGYRNELDSVTPASGDQLEVWLGRPVAFLHLEKTAGMSLASFLTSRFHPLQIDPDPDRTCPPHVKLPFPPHVIERVKRYPLVWGHYDLPSIRRLGDDRFMFTILREPKARILSLYWYWRSHGSLYLGRTGGNECVLAAQSLSLVAFLRCEDPIVRNYIDNFYVRRLTGLYVDGSGDPVLAGTEASLKSALDALGSMTSWASPRTWTPPWPLSAGCWGSIHPRRHRG